MKESDTDRPCRKIPAGHQGLCVCRNPKDQTDRASYNIDVKIKDKMETGYDYT